MAELMSMPITLASMESAKAFVAVVSRYPFEMDLRSGRYVVDAKSILGILSLGNRSDIILDIYADDCSELLAALEPFKRG